MEGYEKITFDSIEHYKTLGSKKLDVFVDPSDGTRFWPLSDWRHVMNLFVKKSSIEKSGGEVLRIDGKQHVSEADLVNWSRHNNNGAQKKQWLRDNINKFHDDFREEVSKYHGLIDRPVYIVDDLAPDTPDGECFYDLVYLGRGRTASSTMKSLQSLGFEESAANEIIKRGDPTLLHEGMTLQGLEIVKGLLADSTGKFKVVKRRGHEKEVSKDEFEEIVDQLKDDASSLTKKFSYFIESMVEVMDQAVRHRGDINMLEERTSKLAKMVASLQETVGPVSEFMHKFENIERLDNEEEIQRADYDVKIKNLIANHCVDVNIEFREAYRRLYREFYKLSSIDIYEEKRRLGSSFSKLQAAKHLGVIEDLYAVALELFG